MVLPSPHDANLIAQRAVENCAVERGVPLGSSAVTDTKTMMRRFWLEGRVGTGQLDPEIVDRSKSELVRSDIAKLGSCLEPLAYAAGTGREFSLGVQSYELARALAIRADKNPAVAPYLKEMGVIR